MNYFVIFLFLYLGYLAYCKMPTCFPLILITYVLLGSFMLGSISPYSIFSGFVSMIFFIKYKNAAGLIKKFPFRYMFLVFIFSLTLTNFGVSHQYRHTPTLVFNICQSAIYAYCIWFLLKKYPHQTLTSLLKISLWFGLLISLYVLYETVTKTNPLLRFLVESGYYIQSAFITEIRFGFKRAQAIFSMHTTLGGVMLFIYALLLVAYKTKFIHQNRRNVLIIFLCALSVFLTGARSCIIAVFVSSLMWLSHIKGKQIFILCMMLPVLSLFAGDYLQQIIDSISNTETVNGSNSDMRLTQLLISWSYLMRSPIWGNGIGFLYNDVVLMNLDSDLYGAESLWFGVMADQGCVGIVAYALLFISSMIYSWQRNNKSAAFFVLATFIMFSLSSIPGVNPAMVPIFTIIINMMMDKSKEAKILKV